MLHTQGSKLKPKFPSNKLLFTSSKNKTAVLTLTSYYFLPCMKDICGAVADINPLIP